MVISYQRCRLEGLILFSSYNKLKVTAEVAKLLVPTPPILGNEYEFNDVDGDGVYTEDVDELLDVVNENIIYSGQSNDVSFFKGIFQSLVMHQEGLVKN